MTDRLAALRTLAFYGDDAVRDPALEQFYQDWKHEALVVNQWLQVQAAIPDEAALDRVRGLLEHPDFDLRNPNKVRALIGIFANQNPVNFHRIDGQGYRFLGDIIAELNEINPQIAARLLTPLTKWRSYRGRAELMQAELQRIAAIPALSPDVYEVVSKSLQ
jgi:aminopeptidase N